MIGEVESVMGMWAVGSDTEPRLRKIKECLMEEVRNKLRPNHVGVN